jgi:hypothetical protein
LSKSAKAYNIINKLFLLKYVFGENSVGKNSVDKNSVGENSVDEKSFAIKILSVKCTRTAQNMPGAKISAF